MELLTSKAWGLLTEEEQTALKLQLGLGKSSWQASEIMGKAHYKYLEIKKRGEKFFKMFQEHFDYYSDDLIPEECLDSLDPDFVEFLTQVIINRKKVNEAITETKSNRLLVSEIRDKIITKNMAYLRNSESLGAKSLYHIIMDFDAWNNFRILPRELQEPHAFTRRNKNRYKKFISNLMALNDFVITEIAERYEAKHLDGAVIYLVLPYKQVSSSKIIAITKEPDAIHQISNMGLFLFSDSEKAKEFLGLVVSYWNLDIKHPKEGQIFWKAYRNILPDVYNMRELENIVPDRKYLTEAIKNTTRKKR